MQIIKNKLLKSTVAKVMAAAMVVTMMPMPVSVSAIEAQPAAETNGESGDSGAKDDTTPATTLPSVDNNTIKLENDVEPTSDIEINTTNYSGADPITLDLNGKTITFKDNKIMKVIGKTLIICDTSNTDGTITREADFDKNISTPLIKVGNGSTQNKTTGDGGIVILKSGKLINHDTMPTSSPKTQDHGWGSGILSTGKSSVIIEGGEINTDTAPLSGNGLLPDSNFYILGGNLIASDGPSIYKPSPGNLFIGKQAILNGIDANEITDNKDTIEKECNNSLASANIILEGSIGLRTGNVRISDGSITRTKNSSCLSTEQIKNLPNQNEYFPDALYVLGGTYGNNLFTNSNDLNITITGNADNNQNPRFTCNQDNGSAIAIYDYGKEKQKIDINIEGGIFTKTATSETSNAQTDVSERFNNRTAFDVFYKNDIGLDDANNDNLSTTDSKIEITGGTFDKLSEQAKKFVDNSVSCFSDDNTNVEVTVAEHNPKSVTAIDAASSNNGIGNIAHYKCTNCNKLYLDEEGKTPTNEEDVKTYCLSIGKLDENIEAKFANGQTSSYGKHKESEILTITPKTGYKITGEPKVTASNGVTVIYEPITNNNDGSYTCTIKANNSGNLNKCELTISAEVQKIDYTLTCNNSSLMNADAKLATTALNKDESTTLTIIPKTGYAFTNKPTVRAEGAEIGEPTINAGVYTYTVGKLTANCTITVSGKATPVSYKVSLDKTGLKDANAYFMRGNDKVNADSVNATVEDKNLQVVIEPNAGKVFTNAPKVNDSEIIPQDGKYIYNVTVTGGDVTLKVVGATEDIKYNIAFTNGVVPTIEHATVRLEPAQAAINGKANLIIEPEAGYRITDTKVEVKDNGKVCTLSEKAELGANGVFIYTISDIKSNVEITSVKATIETAELVESGTSANNAYQANLSDTFASASTEESKAVQEQNHKNILSAVKEAISKITKDSNFIIFENKNLSSEQQEKLVEDIKKAVEEDSSKIALSLEVKKITANTPEKEKEIEDNNKIAEQQVKNRISNSNATVGGFYNFDISLFAQVIKNGEVNKDVKLKLTDTKQGKITIRMKKPEFSGVSGSLARKYYIIRFHEDENGKVITDTIDVTENEDDTLSFSSSAFSTYVLCYTDVKANNDNTISGGGTSVAYPNGSSGGSGGGSGVQSTATPTPNVSTKPSASVAPSGAPSTAPSADSSAAPSIAPSTAPSSAPNAEPSAIPTAKPVAVVKVGQKVTAASVSYKVTSVSGSKTVTVSGSKSAKNVVVPASIKINGKVYKVTAIANNAYKGNKKLIKITIGSNISKIGKNAFSGCTSLKKITIKTTKLTSSKIGKNAFKGINKKAVIKVPKSKVKAYKKIIKARGIGKSVKIK